MDSEPSEQAAEAVRTVVAAVAAVNRLEPVGESVQAALEGPLTRATSPAARSKAPGRTRPSPRRGLRDTVLLSTLYDTAARVQEICERRRIRPG